MIIIKISKIIKRKRQALRPALGENLIINHFKDSKPELTDLVGKEQPLTITPFTSPSSSMNSTVQKYVRFKAGKMSLLNFRHDIYQLIFLGEPQTPVCGAAV